MPRDHRGTPSLPASPVGWVAALMARFDRALAPASGGSGPEPAEPAARSGPFHTGPRVLVVDDNPAHLWDACELLGRWGITPTLAADGAAAVALACGGDFDLILMDLQMPVLDGLAATKQIRVYEQERSCARAPVLAYTSCVLEEDVLRDCGVDGVLEKPCSAKVLQACLLRWCAPSAGG